MKINVNRGFLNACKIITLLLQDGANPNSINGTSATALQFTCYKSFLEMINLLLDQGADVNSANKDGDTALIIACRYNHIETVK